MSRWLRALSLSERRGEETKNYWPWSWLLQEWRHWLEGAAQPFVLWTDPMNLAYLRSAKRLNLDDITGLLPLKGHTVILSIVDRFSKAMRFVLLSKLP